jgi:hypothetical protein
VILPGSVNGDLLHLIAASLFLPLDELGVDTLSLRSPGETSPLSLLPR